MGVSLVRFIKRLFCNHVPKIIKVEFLGSVIRLRGKKIIESYERQAVYQVCIRCGKEHIEEQIIKVK